MVVATGATAGGRPKSKMGAGEKLIIHSEKVRLVDILSMLLLRRPITSYAFVDAGDQTVLDVGDTPCGVLVPLIEAVLKFFAAIYWPVKMVGIAVEFLLNFIALNGGLLGVVWNIFTFKLVIPLDRGAPDFRTVIGMIDGRTELKLAPPAISGGDMRHLQVLDVVVSGEATDLESGDGCAATPLVVQQCLVCEVTVMASKLAYENQAYVENIVKNVWKVLISYKLQFRGVLQWVEQVPEGGHDAGVRDDEHGEGRERGGGSVPRHGASEHEGLGDGRGAVLAGYGRHGQGPRRLPQGAGPAGGEREGPLAGLPQEGRRRALGQVLRLLPAPAGGPGAAQEAPQRAALRHGPQPRRRARRPLPGAPGAARRDGRPRQAQRRADLRPAARRRRQVREVLPRQGDGEGGVVRARGVPVRPGAPGAVHGAGGQVQPRRDLRVLRRVVRRQGARRRRARPQLLRPAVRAVQVRQRGRRPGEGGVPVGQGRPRLPRGRRLPLHPLLRPRHPWPRLAQLARLRRRRPPRPRRAQASLRCRPPAGRVDRRSREMLGS